MNAYDFDKTIYDGDSTTDFTLFMLRQRPSLLRFIPRWIRALFCGATHRLTKTEAKQLFYTYFTRVDDMDRYVEAFWQRNERKIKRWYLAQKQSDDIIISAAPDFLIRPMCRRLGVTAVIASEVDKHTGKYASPNCDGAQKPLRFRTIMPDISIDEFYSDSLSDTPMAQLSKKAFIVKGERLLPWPN